MKNQTSSKHNKQINQVVKQRPGQQQDQKGFATPSADEQNLNRSSGRPSSQGIKNPQRK